MMSRRRHSFAYLSALALASAALMGCAGMRIEPPELFMEKITIDKIGLSGMKMNVYFEVRNVNPRPIVLRHIKYQLTVNDQKVGKGYFSEAVQLGELETHNVKSTLKISWFNLPGAVKKVLEGDMVHGKVVGKFTVVDRGKERELPFNSAADIPISRMP